MTQLELAFENHRNAENAVAMNHCAKSIKIPPNFLFKKLLDGHYENMQKTNPKAVKTFVSDTNLKPLSNKEALKNIR